MKGALIEDHFPMGKMLQLIVSSQRLLSFYEIGRKCIEELFEDV